jgi:hypothetical protein
MPEIPIPFNEDATLPVLRDYLDEHGRVRLSEVRDDLDSDDHLGSIPYALFELVEDGEVALLPVGDEVIIRPE